MDDLYSVAFVHFVKLKGFFTAVLTILITQRRKAFDERIELMADLGNVPLLTAKEILLRVMPLVNKSHSHEELLRAIQAEIDAGPAGKLHFVQSKASFEFLKTVADACWDAFKVGYPARIS